MPRASVRLVPARAPAYAFFLVSAAFHYLGPAFAVLLFARVAPPGVACLRAASAALVFAAWRGPRRLGAALRGAEGRAAAALGAVIALMNYAFYEAIARLPLGAVGAIEFAGPVALAACEVRRRATPRRSRWRRRASTR